MTTGRQRAGRYLPHGARDASTRPVRTAGNSRGRCGHRCRRRRRRWPRPPPCTNVRNLAGPGAGGPVGVAAADVSGAADTPGRRPNPPPGACHAPPIGVAIDPLSRVEHRRPQSGDPPPDGAGPADADRPGLEDDPRPAAGARPAVRAATVTTHPQGCRNTQARRPGGDNSRPAPGRYRRLGEHNVCVKIPHPRPVDRVSARLGRARSPGGDDPYRQEPPTRGGEKPMPSGRLSGGLPGAGGTAVGGAGMAVVDERWQGAPVRPAGSTVTATFDRRVRYPGWVGRKSAMTRTGRLPGRCPTPPVTRPTKPWTTHVGHPSHRRPSRHSADQAADSVRHLR